MREQTVAPRFTGRGRVDAEARAFRKGPPFPIYQRLEVDRPTDVVVGTIPSGSDVWSNGHWTRVPESHPSGVISTLKNHAVKRLGAAQLGVARQVERRLLHQHADGLRPVRRRLPCRLGRRPAAHDSAARRGCIASWTDSRRLRLVSMCLQVENKYLKSDKSQAWLQELRAWLSRRSRCHKPLFLLW